MHWPRWLRSVAVASAVTLMAFSYIPGPSQGGPSLAQSTVSFAPPVYYTAGNNPQDVAVGDVNGDGKLDLVVANATSNDVSVLLGAGAGTFGAATTLGAGSSPRAVAIADLNGDAKLDLAIAHCGAASRFASIPARWAPPHPASTVRQLQRRW
jgi:hypothetical protein